MSASSPRPTVSLAFVLSQGEELLTGQTLDSNAHFLCGKLSELGLRVLGTATAGDVLGEISAAVLAASKKADVVICTGGLGPTADDLTSEAVGVAFAQPLREDPTALAQVEARFERMGRPMARINRKQALLPVGARVLENALGTAPGFIVGAPSGARLYFLPGVPSEMKAMWEAVVLPDLRARYCFEEPQRRCFQVLGVGESGLQALLGPIVAGFAGVALGFRTQMPQNQVKLVADAGNPAFGGAVIAVREALGANLFSEDDRVGLAASIGELLMARGERLALAESCTGGLVGHLCVSVPGSSRWLDRGWLTYSDAAKVQELGVLEDTLQAHGAVSEEVARQMAEGARRRAAVDWAISVTGVAGPGGGTREKPVGTVCVGVAGPAGTRVKTLRLGRDRASNRRFSAFLSLDLLRREILRLPTR